jgi:hypothetical protein
LFDADRSAVRPVFPSAVNHGIAAPLLRNRLSWNSADDDGKGDCGG